jgi:hypothetical protein
VSEERIVSVFKFEGKPSKKIATQLTSNKEAKSTKRTKHAARKARNDEDKARLKVELEEMVYNFT